MLIFVAEVKVHEFASKMAAEPTREWSDEQLKSDDLPKKDIIKFIQDNAAHSVCLSPLSLWVVGRLLAGETVNAHPEALHAA